MLSAGGDLSGRRTGGWRVRVGVGGQVVQQTREAEDVAAACDARGSGRAETDGTDGERLAGSTSAECVLADSCIGEWRGRHERDRDDTVPGNRHVWLGERAHILALAAGRRVEEEAQLGLDMHAALTAQRGAGRPAGRVGAPPATGGGRARRRREGEQVAERLPAVSAVVPMRHRGRRTRRCWACGLAWQ